VNISALIIARYERDGVKFIKVPVATAKALEVSLDYIVANTDLLLEKSAVSKIVDIQKLDGKIKLTCSPPVSTNLKILYFTLYKNVLYLSQRIGNCLGFCF